LLWEIAVRMGLSNGRLVPPPSVIWSTFTDLAATGELARHAFATLWRVAWGFLFGVMAGTIFGAITGYSALTHRVVDPTLQALRSIPSIAWVPLFILWFGIFEASKIILIAVGVFFPVYLGVMGAVTSVDRKIVEVGRVFRLSGPAMVRRILLPAVMPAYVIALRAGLGLGWMFVVAAEFLGASTGLGFLLIDGQQLGRHSCAGKTASRAAEGSRCSSSTASARPIPTECARSTAFRSRLHPAKFSSPSAARDAASRPCCARSRASIRRPRAGWCSTRR
jgi:sulfonate transport system permease protein